ncbi:unnamed protein product [Miscanthus lutarioriparius]|uniref:Uncharacterized protein n=1 Tax=Miscanthus lutarioriparius TaxID=422564 RepID=A0A811N4R7_9POAL|nr:unnamed protein product [Miscanthus lutarioriparius]
MTLQFADAITMTDIYDFLVDIIPRDEMKEDGVGLPRAPMGAPADAYPYYHMPQQQVPGPGMVYGLYAEADKKALEDGANLMLKLAVDILINKKPKLEIQENGNPDAQDGDQPDGWKAS